MPIVSLDPQPIGIGLSRPEKAFVTPGEADVKEVSPNVEEPTFADTFGATMRQENTFTSLTTSERMDRNLSNDPDGIDPWLQIKGTPYEPHFDAFVGVRNQRQFDAVQRDVDREIEDRKTIAASPWYKSLPAALVANIFDPTILIPGGAFYQGEKGGFAIGKTALSVAAGAGAQSAVQESILHAAQSTRTLDESLLNIGSSTFLGGLLGWGGAALLSPGQMRRAINAVDRQTGLPGSDATAIIADIKPQLIAAGMSEEQASANAALVAARYSTRAERLGEGTGFDLYRAENIGVQGGEFDKAGLTAPDASRQFFQGQETAPPFYSAVARTIETAKQEKAPASQWLGTLRNTPGVKPEELEWLGLEGWLKEQKGPVSKQAIADYVRANQIEVKEVEKGLIQPAVRYDEGNIVPIAPGSEPAAQDGGRFWYFRAPDNVYQILKAQYPTEDAAKAYIIAKKQPTAIQNTKFGQYTLPGGENYRELLLTLPGKRYWVDGSLVTAEDLATAEGRAAADRVASHGSDVYRSSHFDEPNILAHVRFNDRVVNGKKTLLVEEVQSDWHQAGKRRGYMQPIAEKDRPAAIEKLHSLEKQLDDLGYSARDTSDYQALEAQIGDLRGKITGMTGVPDAPFKTTWPELALKRMIRYAAENGYEQVAWTTGKTQAERYDLSKHVREIEYIKKHDGTYELGVTDHSGDHVRMPSDRMTIEQIEETVGKEIAEKIANGEGRKYRGHEGTTLDGLDLRVGGEGMSGFYDKMLPAAANKLTKKYGGKVERGDLGIEQPKGKYSIEETQTQDGPVFAVEGDATATFFADRASAEAHIHQRLQELRYGEAEPVHVLPVTDKLREAALGEGFPLFQAGEGGPRGRITLAENKAIIDLFGKADASTFPHEAGHLWLDELIRDAAKAGDGSALKGDLDKVLAWLKVDSPEAIGRAQHEQWARGFERYLAEGKAPSSALAQVFEKFKEWLSAIYKSLTDMGVPVSADVRGVMDRLLATDQQIAARNPMASGLTAGSLGAAAVSLPGLEQTKTLGKAAGAVATLTQELNPDLRLAQSQSPYVHDTAARLFEISRYRQGNAEGIATPRSAETLRKQWEGGLMRAIKESNDLYAEYRKRTGSYGLLQKTADVFGSQRTSFDAQVGRTLRRGDQHPEPEIQKSAESYRKNVIEPMKDAAIEVGLFKPDVAVSEAASYFMRLWNSRRISGEEDLFKSTVIDWALQNMPQWERASAQGVERRLEPLRRELSDIEMAKLRRGEELKAREQGGEIEAGEFNESDIRRALQIVDGGAPKPKGVQTLTQFIHSQGGLVDFSGELAHMGINNKSRPGFIRTEKRRIGPNNKINGGGWDFDSMARHAWENGYFSEHQSPPSLREFLETLSDDFNKRRAVLRQEDRDAYRLTELVDQLDQDLARIGASTTDKARFSTSAEVKGIVSRVFQAMDAADDRRADVLKGRLAEREAEARVEHEAKFNDHDQAARDIADEVFNTMTGRGSDGIRREFITIKARGPLHERTFHIPDTFVSKDGIGIERWLEDDARLVNERYTRVMGTDIELARQFGSPDMAEQVFNIHRSYDDLRARATTPKERLALADQEKADINDITAVRDILRGTYKTDAWEGNFGRISRRATALEYTMKMGQVVPSSILEVVRLPVVRGLMPFMQDAFAALGNPAAFKMQVRDARFGGNITDRVLSHRLATIADITDFYGNRTPFDRFLDNMTNVASAWNGIRIWTDMVKSIASSSIQNRILRGVQEFSDLKGSESAYFHHVGIDANVAERIARRFEQHGQEYGGVFVANVDEWTRNLSGGELAAARADQRAYFAALNKDMDSMVVTAGAADTPLLARTPLGRMLFQFNTFNLASHQRVLLRGLQEGHARFLSGAIALSSLGMLQVILTAYLTNSQSKLPEFSKNPGWWIAEGLDKAGIFQVPMYLSNASEKLVGLNPIKTPMRLGDEGGTLSQKNRNRNQAGFLLGPSGSSVQDALEVAGGVRSAIKGEPVSKSAINSGVRLLPYNSFIGVRQMEKYFLNPPNE